MELTWTRSRFDTRLGVIFSRAADGRLPGRCAHCTMNGQACAQAAQFLSPQAEPGPPT